MGIAVHKSCFIHGDGKRDLIELYSQINFTELHPEKHVYMYLFLSF